MAQMIYYHEAMKSNAIEASKQNFPGVYKVWKTYSCLVISSSTAERTNKYVQSYVDGLSMDLQKTGTPYFTNFWLYKQTVYKINNHDYCLNIISNELKLKN